MTWTAAGRRTAARFGRRARFSLSSSPSSLRRSPCFVNFHYVRTAVSLSFHSTPTRLSDADETSASPPPIVWTTHRLSQEQIEKVDAIFHKLLFLDLFETSMLTNYMNERLGRKITPKQRRAIERQLDALEGGSNAGGGAASADAADGADAAEAAAAPKLLDLKLAAFDAKAKIKVIKEIRAVVPGLGLKEAKELVEAAPKVIQEDLKEEQANELKERLEAVGAEIELVEAK